MNLKVQLNTVYQRLARAWCFPRGEYDVVIRLRQPLALIGLIVLISWGLIAPAPLALVGSLLLASLLLSSYGWVRLMVTHVTTKRALRYAAVQVGDELEEMVELENRSGLPVIWAEFVDRSTAPGYSISGVRVAGRRAHEHWRLHTTCSQRNARVA